MLNWIDTHAHLDKLPEGPDEAVRLALEAGVTTILTIGTEEADLPVVLNLARKWKPHVYCTLGVHPHEGSTYNIQVEKFILEHANEPEVVAVGEIGLDYYYNHSNKEDQIKAFRRQLELAEQLQLPVEIHTRDAEEDTVDLLKKFEGKVKGLIHCFTGSQWLADQCLKLGYNISISGVVTFKNAQSLRDVVASIPLDRLHVETDSPFLAPVPLRGKSNTPAYVTHVAAKVAEVKGVSLEVLARASHDNTQKLFTKIK